MTCFPVIWTGELLWRDAGWQVFLEMRISLVSLITDYVIKASTTCFLFFPSTSPENCDWLQDKHTRIKLCSHRMRLLYLGWAKNLELYYFFVSVQTKNFYLAAEPVILLRCWCESSQRNNKVLIFLLIQIQNNVTCRCRIRWERSLISVSEQNNQCKICLISVRTW